MAVETKKMSSIVGPYEHWVLGQTGRTHSGLQANIKPMLGGIVELPNAVVSIQAGNQNDLEQALQKPEQALLDFGFPEKQLLPTLWLKTASARGEGISYFLPCLAQFPSKTDAITMGSRSQWFNATKGLYINLVSDWNLEEPKPEYGYRFNAPLPPDTVNAGFAAGPVEHQPDAALRKRLSDDPGKIDGKPLAIMAVIDDGLPFAHPHFRDASGLSRVECCWLQSCKAKPGSSTVLFGQELRRDAIDELVKRHAGRETDIYRDANSRLLTQAVSHGALVMDIAAGHRHASAAAAANGRALPRSGDLDRMRIIGVELPPATVIDTEGFGKDFHVLSAFHYVFRRADEIAASYGLAPADVPLIINFSFGFSGGPHDGRDRLEEAIAQLVGTRKGLGCETHLVMPSGNEFLSALYGEIRSGDATDGKAPVRWRVQPNDRTSNYLEIWYPAREKGDRSGQPGALDLTSPAGETFSFSFTAMQAGEPDAQAPQFIADIVSADRIIGQVSLDFHRNYRWRIMVILAPTEVRDPALAATPAGLWTIKVDAVPLLGGEDAVCCRIQRDNATRDPWQGGRQSYFDDPRDRRFDKTGALAQSDEGATFVRRFGTLNGLATHGEVTVVAGYDRATCKPADYSSAGLLNPSSWATAGVDCAAPSDDSPVLRGQRAAGAHGAAVGRLVGTSAAAPAIARMIAVGLLDGVSQASARRTTAPLDPRLGAEPAA